MERAFAVISGDEPDEDLALLAARLSRAYWFSGDLERAAERAEFALDIAEAHAYPRALSRWRCAAKAAVVFSRGHIEEANALLRHALQIAVDNDLVEDAGICYFLLSDGRFRSDQYPEALGYLDEALALSRKMGDRPTSGRRWPNAPTRSTCSAAGTRRETAARSSQPSRSTPAA